MLRNALGKLWDSLLIPFVKADRAVRELKEDENAMEVIQVVMLIAVGVLAIVAIWAGVNGLLEEFWDMIMGANRPGGPSNINP